MLDECKNKDLTGEEGAALLLKIRVSALNLLARREHSFSELELKLRKKYACSPAAQGEVFDVLDNLRTENLQSNQRFAEAFVRSRVGSGQGELRISMELQKRGVADHNVAQAFAEEQPDWFELARLAAIKRFGVLPAQDYQQRAKRARFLQYRGFSMEEIEYALA